ncbi:branched-chain amino acid ABC transporter permease [Chloroflexota bacterium]
MEFFLHLVVLGIAVGAIYAMVALGFVLIYKSTKVLNFAQGTLVMIGAFMVYAFLNQFSLPIAVALPLSLAVAVALGFVIERLALRPLIGEPLLSMIMVTIGLASLLKGGAIAVWTTENFSLPEILPDASLYLGSVFVSSPYVWGFVISVVMLLVFSLFFKYSKLGIAMRAVANDQMAAMSMGINVRWVFAISWVIAAVVATVGGFFLGTINIININLEFIGLKVFPVAILGGLDSIPGAIVGGLIIGVLENLVGGYLSPVLGGGIKAVAPFVILLLILLVKPYGLFGTRQVERL